MKFWRKLNTGCLLLVAIPLFILAGLWVFADWAWGGSIKLSLDAQYIPTAEYLIEHPEPTPSFLFIYPEPSTKLKSVEVLINLDVDRTSLNRWTYLFLNGQRLSHKDTSMDVPAGIGLPETPDRHLASGYVVFYHTGMLGSGLHLFRIQIGSSFNDLLNPDPKLGYEWAYRVE